MLAGRYPSEEFAELRPRLVWDRVDGHAARAGPAPSGWPSPAAAPSPTAACSACSWPCRGAEQAARAGSASSTRRWCTSRGSATCSCSAPARGGSRTSPPTGCWSRPRPGQPGKLPFWHGDAPGRPAELGRAHRRVLPRAGRGRGAGRPPPAASGRAWTSWPPATWCSYLAEQREATGYVPDDRTLVVERFRDELGDWRVVLHSPYGARVHAPWALAIAARLRERYGGMDVQALHTDDGIVIRVPDTRRAAARPGSPLLDAGGGRAAGHRGAGRLGAVRVPVPRVRRPGAAAAAPAARPAHAAVAAAAAVRAAARGGLPVRARSRSCWRPCGSACRTCSTCPALTALMRDIAGPQGAGGRGGDADAVAVRQVAAVRLRRRVHVRGRRAAGRAPGAGAGAGLALLAELLGQAGPAGAARPRGGRRDRARAAAPGPAGRCRDAEGVADLLRTLGPLTARRGGGAVRRTRRPRRLAGGAVGGPPGDRGADRGRGAWAAIEDAGRLRDALGRAAAGRRARGVHRAGRRPAGRPGGPVRADARPVHRRRGGRPVRARRGGGDAGAAPAGGGRPGGRGRVPAPRPGRGAPSGATPRCCGCCGGGAWPGCARRSSRCRPRRWPGSCPPGTGSRPGPGGAGRPGRRADAGAVLEVIEQLAGAPVPASALETLVLPARVPGYSPALLDELTAAGEVVWAGAGGAARRRRLAGARARRRRAAAAARAGRDDA